MNFIAYSFWAVLVLFVLEEFVLNKSVSTISASDPTSKLLERLALIVPFVAIAVTCSTLKQFGGLRFHGIVNVFGIVLCLTGTALRFWSRRTLGRFFTIGVVKQEGHVVVQHGPYHFVRHPAYLALLIFYLGLTLLFGSWLGVVILFLPSCVIFVCLSQVEDQRLSEKLGTEYQDYIRRSARFIPGVW